MKKTVTLSVLFRIFTLSGVVLLQTSKTVDLPIYLEEKLNITAILGRDAVLNCRVRNLDEYQVAWLRVDTQTLLVIGKKVITKNHRVSASHYNDDWKLTLRDVSPKEGGVYMCQINTEPMMKQIYHLNIVEPPDINLKASSSDIIVKEHESASLVCVVSGVPTPNVTWRREDSNQFRIDNKTLVTKWSGERLTMSLVDRTQSGAYLCIANNGVPPTVSKRILLNVMFPPSVMASRAGIRALSKSVPSIQCTSEAYPPPNIYWTLNQVHRIANDTKYSTSISSKGYRQVTTLRVLEMGLEHAGAYRCHVENNLGAAEAEILLHLLTTTTTTSTTTTSTTTTTTTTTTPTPPNTSTLNAKSQIIANSQQIQNLVMPTTATPVAKNHQDSIGKEDSALPYPTSSSTTFRTSTTIVVKLMSFLFLYQPST